MLENLPRTISSSELVWFLLNTTAIVCLLMAMNSVRLDRAAISPYSRNYRHKLEITTWCFIRQCHMLAIVIILEIVILNSWFILQPLDWSPTIIGLTSIPLIIMSKTMYDLFKKNSLLRDMS